MERTGHWLHAGRQRVARGERWWAAELVLRGAGVLLLGLCAGAARSLHRSVTLPAPHPAHPFDYLVALFAVACWCSGWALAVVGPGLFKHIPVPGRHWTS